MMKHDVEPLQTAGISFAPVMHLPEEVEVYDFTRGYDPSRTLQTPYGVGRYNEHRPGMYLGEQFVEGERNIHVGIDLAAPVGEPIYAFYGGTIFALGDNDRPYDYGPTLITRHEWLGQKVYALHGHLSRTCLERWAVGDGVEQGQVLGAVGSQEENGGWNPHLHFQLSLIEPTNCDLPGAVSQAHRAWALQVFPDPRLVLGPLHP